MSQQTLAQDQESAQAQLISDDRARGAAHQRGLDPRELTFRKVGEPVIQNLADNGSQDRVAQKLEPFIRLDARA